MEDFGGISLKDDFISSQTRNITVLQEFLQIASADNGQGSDEKVQEKIFNHLFTTEGVGKGTGLGLTSARQIVTEKHGGTIEVNSRPGEGTEFAIELPI